MICVSKTRGAQNLDNCDTLDKVGANEADVTDGNQVASITMTSGGVGVFTITGAASVDDVTYVLTPTVSGGGNTLSWDDDDSSCIAAGLC